jgi:hypothetical protein
MIRPQRASKRTFEDKDEDSPVKWWKINYYLETRARELNADIAVSIRNKASRATAYSHNFIVNGNIDPLPTKSLHKVDSIMRKYCILDQFIYGYGLN